MDLKQKRSSQKKKGSSQRRNNQGDGSSQEPTHVPETQLPYQQPFPLSPGFGYQNQNPPPQQMSPQQNYFQYHQFPPGFPFQNQNPQQNYYVPDTSHLRVETPPHEVEQPEDNNDNPEESSDETPPLQQDDSPRNYTQRLKRRPWREDEEVALARAFIQCSMDHENGNKKRASTLWEDVRVHFVQQIGGSDRTTHQLNSKWKDMQTKVNRFNCIYNRIKNKPESGRSDLDIETKARKEHNDQFRKAFQHDGAWRVLKDYPKWLTVGLVGTNEPHFSSKRNKSSASGDYTSGSDPRFSSNSIGVSSIGVSEERGEDVEQPERTRRRKGKKALADELEAESRDRYRLSKLAIFEKTEATKAQILEEELRALKEKRFEKDMAVFFKPHDHLTGGELEVVLARKQRIADFHGWKL